MEERNEGVTSAMNIQENLLKLVVLLLCLIFGTTATALAQRDATRDPLAGLKRAITEASAPALTTDQETALNALITAYRAAQPTGPDEALDAAREAYEDAILALDVAAANAQAAIIVERTAALSSAALQLSAKFKIDVLNNLKTGGQLDPLAAKYSEERLLSIVSSLAGRGIGGGPGGGHGGPGGRR
jgi:hypothetical protein